MDITIYASDSAYVDSATPNTRYQTAELKTQFNYPTYQYAIARFNDASLIGMTVQDFRLSIYLNSMTRPNSSSGHSVTSVTIPLPPFNTIVYADLHNAIAKGQSLGAYTAMERDYPGMLGTYVTFGLYDTNRLMEKLQKVVQNGAIFRASTGTYYTFGSHTAAKPPMLVVAATPATPIIHYESPTGGLIDKTKPTPLYWSYRVDNPASVYGGNITLQYSTLRWRAAGAGNYTEIQIAGDNRYTIPANTFSTDYVEWQVQVTSTASVSSAWSPWYRLTTVDSLSTAKAISPRAAYLAGNEPNTFVWRHTVSTGTAQTAAKLQTSTDGVTWQDLATVTGGAQQTTLPPGALSGDVRYWRVCTANRDAAWGQWSEAASIMVYAAPLPPALAVPENTPHITLHWQSAEQCAYAVKAGDWASGPIHGTAKVYTLPQYFPDGPVTVGVRVQSSQGLWSEWAETLVTVANQPQPPVSMTSREVPDGVKLQWMGSHEAYLVYRDGQPIHATTDTSYTDWMAAGKHRYAVWGINGRFYSVSNAMTQHSKTDGAALSDLQSIAWVRLKYRRDSAPIHTASTQRPVELQHFAGREKPVALVAAQLDKQHTADYSLADYDQLQRLEGLVGRTIIFKERNHTALVGVLLAVERTGDWAGFDVTITIAETDYKEGPL